MWTVYFDSEDYARATVQYATEFCEAIAEYSYDNSRKSWRVVVDCELKRRRQILGFVDGLEYASPTE